VSLAATSIWLIWPNQLYKWKARALERLPELFEDEHKTEKSMQAAHEQQLDELYAQIGRSNTQLAWLKKNLVPTLSRDERYQLIERDNPELTLSTQAELLNLNRTGLYYEPAGPTVEEIAVKHRIDEIYTAHPYYGSRRIMVTLCKEGRWISRPTVQCYMREMGITVISPGPNLSQRSAEHKIYPYLLRGLGICYPNQVWGVDITYIRLRSGWMYLVAILDWFSRYVVGWEIDQTLEMPYVLRTVERALLQARPMIWNSDQGSHFTSPQYTDKLLAAGIQISMDGKGRAIDNIFTERLWRTIKYEDVYLNDYVSPREARQGIDQYLAFYNHQRPHQSLGYQTLAQVYSQLDTLSDNE
jgi:putative transposase